MDKNLRNYPFWLLCIALCFGVSLGNTFSLSFIYLVGFIISITLLILWFYKKSNVLFIIVSCIGFTCIGALRHIISQPENQKNHIINYDLGNEKNQIIFTVLEKFKSSNNHLNYKIAIQKIDNSITRGNSLISIKKDSVLCLKLGNSYVGSLKISPLKLTKNPYAFEYTDYLQNKHISHQIWTSFNAIHNIPNKTNWFTIIKYKIRDHISTQLSRVPLSKNVQELTKALVIGDRSEFSKEVTDSFSKAGIIHVLAISGLHIGILFLLFQTLFKWLLGRKHKIMQSVSIIILLWGFTWFAGLNDSAVRATTMFSCFQLATILQKEQHPINALFLSVFILVFINPYILFSVGFQLSVVAVFSIILGTPLFFSLWYPKNNLLNKLWSITAVSICAQIGLLPLSLFYFHQFSGAFLIANIPVMIAIAFILIFAISIVVFSSLNIPFELFFRTYNFIISHLFNYIDWVASLEKFIFKNIHIHFFTLCCLSILITLITYIFYNTRKRTKHVWYVFLLIIAFSSFEKMHTITKNELWLLNTSKNLIFTEITSKKLQVYSQKLLSANELKYAVKPIKNALHYKYISSQNLKESYAYYGKEIFILSNEYSIEFLKPNSIVVLNNSPKINLERLIKKHNPSQIIVSQNNYPSFIKKWKSTCKKLQVDFYNISKQGALCLK